MEVERGEPGEGVIYFSKHGFKVRVLRLLIRFLKTTLRHLFSGMFKPVVILSAQIAPKGSIRCEIVQKGLPLIYSTNERGVP